MRRKNNFVGILFLMGLVICVSITQFLIANPFYLILMLAVGIGLLLLGNKKINSDTEYISVETQFLKSEQKVGGCFDSNSNFDVDDRANRIIHEDNLLFEARCQLICLLKNRIQTKKIEDRWTLRKHYELISILKKRINLVLIENIKSTITQRRHEVVEELKKTFVVPDLPNYLKHESYISIFFSHQNTTILPSVLSLNEYADFFSSIRETTKNRLLNRMPKYLNYIVSEPSFLQFPVYMDRLSKLKLSDSDLMPFNFLPEHVANNNGVVISDKGIFIDEYNSWLSRNRNDHYCYYQKRKKDFEEKVKCIKDQWHQAKEQWESEALKDIKKYKELCSGYESCEPDGVAQYFIAQIDAIPLLSCCDREYEIEFDPQEGILLLNLKIPYMRDVEIVKTRKLVSGEKEVPVTQKEAREIMNQLPFLILMRVIWEIPHVDYKDKITLIACNGYVVYDDPATGKTRQDIILSIAAKPDDLKQILLEKIDPEACFRSLKGVAASKITDLVPVMPIIQFNKNDSRFVLAKEVIEGIDGDNLATMDWQDFEHLIRDLFEKEFGRSGAEVKITQASRDRGVDAIAFDPDPLRGGKFVIQAKRYSNTVDVSAVRDLYGTIMNEGANRGILVTTSNFGRDSYEFAKDKPISLMNGGNLLHLLEKHGYHAKIDLKEAKKLLKVTS